MIDLSLLEDFVMGAGESLEEMETALLTLDSNPDDVELLNTIFRAIHTIKGAAQFVGLDKVSELSHALEDLLDLLREGKKQATSDIIEVLIQAKDRISQLTSDLERSQTEETEVDDLVQLLNIHLKPTPENVKNTEAITVDEALNAFQPEEENKITGSFLESSDAVENLLSENELDSFLLDESNTEDQANEIDNLLSENELDSFILDESNTEDKTNEIDNLLSENELDSFLLDESNTEDQANEINNLLSENELGSFLLGTGADDLEINDVNDLLQIDPQEATPPPTSTHSRFVLPTEEHDQELFGIFILQLREKFVLLNNNVVQLETSYSHKKEALLNQTIEILESLKFSANYMAYEKLTDFYGNWIDNILNTQKILLKTNTVSFLFMRENLFELQNIFPQLNVETIGTEQSDTLKATPEDDLNSQVAFIDDIVQNETIESRFQPVETADEPKTEPLKITENLNNSDVNGSKNKQALYHKLSLALDTSVIEQSIISEPINEVFSALLDSTEKQQKYSKEIEVQDLILDVKTLKEVNASAPIIAPEPVKHPPTPEVHQEAAVEIKPSKPKSEQSPPRPNKTTPPKVTETASPKKAFKKSIRVDADKIDSLMNQVGELIVDRAYFFQLATEISELQQLLKASGVAQKNLKLIRTFAYRFSEAILALGRTSNALQENVMKVRMLPMTQLFNRFPRLVHDVANTNHKKVFLKVVGEETELDKMIIEEIADPLMHMIRNAIDHGIELPEDRVKSGKPEAGRIVLEAYNESNHIVIEITDDGRGIDIERIKDKAEKIALFTREELDRMSANDLTRFIMMPGFSTAKEVSSTSGRGVGMDVVKKNIEKLNGTIDVESKKGIETKMRLKIPLTLAIIPALLVKVANDPFTIPLTNVEETLRVQQNDISMMEETEVMYLRGRTIPIFRLATLFSMKSPKKIEENDFFVVIVNTGTQKIGLMVDSLIGQDEVVIKPLADYLYEQNCFSGATIIGDGRVSLIIDVYELVAMTTKKLINKHHQQEKNHFHSLLNEE
jgi:two-component system chemotaxis sensor kinase CheA